jgi:hypothetical protein
MDGLDRVDRLDGGQAGAERGLEKHGSVDWSFLELGSGMDEMDGLDRVDRLDGGKPVRNGTGQA